MISHEVNEVVGFLEGEELIDHPFGIGPAVDVVSQSDDKIIGSWLDDIEQGSEGSEASVNISNGDSHDANARSWNGIWKEQYFKAMIQMKMGAWSIGECVFDSTGKLADQG